MNIIKMDSDVANDVVNDDVIQPFQLEVSSLRGRLVRLGPVLDTIIEAHGYPRPVSHLLAETVTLTLLLSSMLKYDGVFTLQVSSEGPVRMLVADVTNKGYIRACAGFDKDSIKDTDKKEDMLGKGHIAFTVDQGQHMERYQGIVSITEGDLQKSIDHYFEQSEQIGTGLKMAIQGPTGKAGNWRAGAIMLQHLPDEGGHLDHKDRKHISVKEDSEDMDEDWRRANILLETCTAEEFLAPALDGNELLVRLFHEEGVRVYEPTSVVMKCRCSEEKTKAVIASLSEEDKEDMADDGKISVTCEFCNSTYIYDISEL